MGEVVKDLHACGLAHFFHTALDAESSPAFARRYQARHPHGARSNSGDGVFDVMHARQPQFTWILYSL